MEVNPINSLNSLLNWNGPGKLKTILDTIPAVASRASSHPEDYSTLVCHDMKGGYLDDKFCFGTENLDAYRFYQWSAIDIFVYFSHKFITIPPYGWTYAAHTNGVKILGTIITEWEYGETIWDTILDDAVIIDLVITKLVEIACAYKFEGWLVNIENKIKPEKIPRLIFFLHELTKAMHLREPNSQVIWYDAVTKDGELKWQDQLNIKNECFFNVCDGIFLNYTWKEDGLSQSKEAAGRRFRDVYVGIDMFGRNCWGGGGFSSHKALEVIRRYKLSTAIFAQGWAYEVFGSESFTANESKLWKDLEPFLSYRGPTQLPFKTSFCQGFGKNYYYQGKLVEEGPWYNLSRQEFQPNWQQIYRETSSLMNINTDDAFNGGSCLTLWVDLSLRLRLMDCKFWMGESIECSFAYKIKGSISYLSFVITVEEERSPKDSVTTLHQRDMLWIALGEKPSDAPDDGTYIVAGEAKEVSGWSVTTFVLPNIEGYIKRLSVDLKGPGVLMFGEVSFTKSCLKEKSDHI